MTAPTERRPSLAARLAWLGTAALLATAAAAEPPAALVAAGDAAWDRRAEGRHGLEAAAGPIAAAVAAYEAALAEAPASVDVRQRLLRAVYFQGRFATSEAARRRALYARGRDLAEEGLDQLAADLGLARLDPADPEEVAAAVAGRPEAVQLFFWAAAHWGLWGETNGLVAAARSGVAAKVRRYAEAAIAIDEGFAAGGALRVRGRLHTEAPRIPLVTGWVDRGVAISSLERAVALAPEEPQNRLYLAEALLRFRRQRRDEALAMLRALARETPRPDFLLEDEETLTAARDLLASFR